MTRHMLATATHETLTHASHRMQNALAVHAARPSTVLLIDDDPDTRLLVRCLLGRTGRFERLDLEGSGGTTPPG